VHQIVLRMRLRVLAVGCSLAAIACRDASAPVPAPEAARVPASVSAAFTPAATDTIDAMLAQSIAVTVRDAKGATVSGASVRVAWSSSGAGPVTFAPAGSPTFASTVLLATDAEGVARASARLGRTSGAGYVVVTEASKSLSDSVRLTVHSGAPFRFTNAPRDTAMIVGGTITLSPRLFDRADNPLSIALSTADPSCTIGPDDLGTRVITGVAAGTCRITLGAPANTSFRVTVVAASEMLASGGSDLSLVRLDGTGLTTIHHTYLMYDCVWLSSGVSLVCPDSGKLKVLRLDTNTPIGLDASAQTIDIPGVKSIGLVRASWDRNWIVFTGYSPSNVGGGNATLYRSRIDGSQLQVLAADCCSSIVPSFDISPDGNVVIYSSYSTIRVDVARNSSQVIQVGRERFARFSPDGSSVAYQDGADILLSDPDGSNVRTIYTSPKTGEGPYYLHLEWSPDSKWLLTIGFGDRPFLIAADGSTRVRADVQFVRSFRP
jgi:hypothetical protein